LDNVRATILQLRPFPTLEQVFALVNREENRQGVMLNKEIGVENSMVMFAKGPALTMNKPNFNSKFKTGSVEGCTHCGFTNHTRDRCFKIIGYPEGWKDRKKKRQQRGEAHMVTSHPKEVALNGSDASRPTSSTAADPSTAQAATIISMNKHSILPPVENKEGNTCFVSDYSTNNLDWIIDSGATDHMTYSAKDLVKTSKPRRMEIVNANGESHPVTAAGDVLFSSSLILPNTLLVPSLSTRLLSVGQICEELNCAVLMYPQFCIFQDLLTKEVIGRGTKRGRLYHLDDMVTGKAHLSTGSSLNRKSHIWMWHKRLGHPSFGYLRKLYPSLFSGYEHETFSCVACIKAKSHRVHFSNSLNKRTNPFDLIHSDVWGPSPVSSSSGNRWFVLFIDNCTRMTWLYVLKTKDEVPYVFKTFFKMVRNQFGKMIKYLRSDNGGEFVNKVLRDFFNSQGIIHETSCIGTPQQNGVAERKNRHVLETARSMLLEYDVPQVYWDHAVATAIYLINRMPSVVLNFQTPLQVLSSYFQIPSILNLPPKIFGCVAYVHIQKHQRSKLAPCAEKCVFVGYGQNQKGYKCVNPSSKRTYVTMDVTFLENESFFKRELIPPQGENLTEEESWFNGPPADFPSGLSAEPCSGPAISHPCSTYQMDSSPPVNSGPEGADPDSSPPINSGPEGAEPDSFFQSPPINYTFNSSPTNSDPFTADLDPSQGVFYPTLEGCETTNSEHGQEQMI
jgi:GAG-pre-integrase domain/Integrase core domain